MGIYFDPLQNKMTLEPAVPIQTITADTTLLSLTNLVYEIGTLTADITITTPALINGWNAKLLANNNTTYTVTISAASGNIYFGTMAGATSITLDNTFGGMYEIYCDGSDFYILESSPIGISGSGASAGLVTVFDSNLQKLVPAVAGVGVKTGKNTIDDGNGNAIINGSLTTSTGANQYTYIGVGNNVGTVNFVSNTDGTNGAYIEWFPQSGMPNQLNITSIGTSNLNILTFAAINTNFNGNIQLNGALMFNSITSLAGITRGNISWSQYFQGQFKAFAAQFIGYENDSTTNQTITFPTPFVNTPIITVNTTGLTITVTTTTLTINAPDNTTTYSGIVEVKGF